jgi:hypothetical protein
VLRSIYRIRRRSDTLYKAVISLANYYILRILFGVRFHVFQNITFYPIRMVRCHFPSFCDREKATARHDQESSSIPRRAHA